MWKRRDSVAAGKVEIFIGVIVSPRFTHPSPVPPPYLRYFVDCSTGSKRDADSSSAGNSSPTSGSVARGSACVLDASWYQVTDGDKKRLCIGAGFLTGLLPLLQVISCFSIAVNRILSVHFRLSVVYSCVRV